ncbi:hypothetical protein VNO78_26982 [Psophocarpus tetragonolobus]|uniref:Uncharacterized protein n=1 Tax=Psophocarpus tetragonolobus TaxID=3891 RepID=A0AAN9S009_PSOTE
MNECKSKSVALVFLFRDVEFSYDVLFREGFGSPTLPFIGISFDTRAGSVVFGSINEIGKETKAWMRDESVSFYYTFLIPEKHNTFSAPSHVLRILSSKFTLFPMFFTFSFLFIPL